MKRIIAATTVALILIAAFYWHEATEGYGPDGDEGDGWRTVVGWILLALYLLAMAALAAAGLADDDARHRAELEARGQHVARRRHRIRYADHSAVTYGTPEVLTVRAFDRGTRPIPVVLDEQPTGGER